MGTIKIKKDGKEYIEGLIVDQAEDTRLYLKTDAAPSPYTIRDGDGYFNTAFGPYDKVTNVWALNLPLTAPGSEFFVVIPGRTDISTPTSTYPSIDSDTNRRGFWAITTIIKPADTEVTLRFANGDDELAPGFQEWDQIYWPSGSSTLRVGIWFWNGEKWRWFGRDQ